MILCVNGRMLPQPQAKLSALDNGFLYGDGFYDTMRTYDGVILELEEHLTRMQYAAQRMKIRLPWSRNKLGLWILRTVAHNKLKNARVRITVTRGECGLDFVTSCRPTLVISAEPLTLPAHIHKKGVSTATMRMQRLMPDIKTIGLTHMIVGVQRAHDLGVYEMICRGEDGHILEGVSTNVFIVKRGTLLTPKKGMLLGITRKRVLSLARRMKLRVHIHDVGLASLRSADEVFLVNQLREIIPVVKVDGQRIGSGKPGSITRRLMEEYAKFVADYVEKNRSSQRRDRP